VKKMIKTLGEKNCERLKKGRGEKKRKIKD
jgi:hypothetical protein